MYSYGVVLWEIATQKIPWDNLNAVQVFFSFPSPHSFSSKKWTFSFLISEQDPLKMASWHPFDWLEYIASRISFSLLCGDGLSRLCTLCYRATFLMWTWKGSEWLCPICCLFLSLLFLLGITMTSIIRKALNNALLRILAGDWCCGVYEPAAGYSSRCWATVGIYNRELLAQVLILLECLWSPKYTKQKPGVCNW